MKWLALGRHRWSLAVQQSRLKVSGLVEAVGRRPEELAGQRPIEEAAGRQPVEQAAGRRPVEEVVGRRPVEEQHRCFERSGLDTAKRKWTGLLEPWRALEEST